MIRTVVFLALVAYASARTMVKGETFKGGLKVRFDIFELASNENELPQSVDSAVQAGWEQQTRPAGPKVYQNLSLCCPEAVCTINALFDDIGNIAELQIALPKEEFGNYFDETAQGFISWTYTEKKE